MVKEMNREEKYRKDLVLDSREVEPIGHVCIERGVYFKKLAHTVVGDAKSTSEGQTSRLEAWRGVDIASHYILHVLFPILLL